MRKYNRKPPLKTTKITSSSFLSSNYPYSTTIIVEVPVTKALDTTSFTPDKSTNTRDLLVPLSGGVALLISVLVVVGIFTLIYYRRSKVIKAEKDKVTEPCEDPQTPKTPGMRKRWETNPKTDI